jgi:hypothetical protein
VRGTRRDNATRDLRITRHEGDTSRSPNGREPALTVSSEPTDIQEDVTRTRRALLLTDLDLNNASRFARKQGSASIRYCEGAL